MTKTKQRVYANPKQIEFLQAKQKRKGIVGGRGSGKSSCLGFESQTQYNYLPRAKGFIAGLTYNQILTKTLPSAMDAWAMVGVKEYDKHKKRGHFVVNKTPPLGWIKPYQAPRNFENAITFINGFTLELLSLDRPDTARGGNYDFGHVDESALVKKEIIGKVLLPMIRANKYVFDSPYHWSFCHYTSAAWLPTGQWIYDYEEMQKEKPDRYKYVEATAYDNIEVLTQEYIDDLEAELDPLEFQVEVLNKRIKKLPNCFYPSFDESKHCKADTFDYQYDDEHGLWLSTASDRNTNKPLELTWDFNAAITSLHVCQEHGAMELRFLDTLYLKQAKTNLVDDLCDKFIAEYASHACKVITIYGDRNGNSKSAGSNKTFYEQIDDKLTAAGWKVTLKIMNAYPDHMLKHRVINAILAENNTRLPHIRINQTKCKYLIISIQNSPIKPDWTKDKRGESLVIQQERTTHLSDAFDYIIFQKYAHLIGQQNNMPYLVKFM